MFATYMRRMRDNNLEIRIAGSSCRPQLAFNWKISTNINHWTILKLLKLM